MLTKRDIARVALQSAAAGVVTFLVMRYAGLTHMSWAIIAALFTIHVSADDAIGAAVYRVVGTVLGAALGLAVVFLFSSFALMVLRVALVAAVANALAAYRPKLAYAAAAGAVVALQPHAGLEGAMGTALAIAVGSTAGVAANLLIWPDFGRDRALRSIALALRLSSDLVDISLGTPANGGDQDRARIHRHLLGHLRDAGEAAREARFRRRLTSGSTLNQMIEAADRLWTSLIIIDRVVSEHHDRMDPEDLASMQPHLQEAKGALCRLLCRLSDVLEGTVERPDVEDWRRVEEAERLARAVVTERSHGRDSDAERAIQALLFGLEEVRAATADLQLLAVRARPSDRASS